MKGLIILMYQGCTALSVERVNLKCQCCTGLSAERVKTIFCFLNITWFIKKIPDVHFFVFFLLFIFVFFVFSLLLLKNSDFTLSIAFVVHVLQSV